MTWIDELLKKQKDKSKKWMKRLREKRKRTEEGRKIIRDRKIYATSNLIGSIVHWESKKHMRAYRKRLKKKNPEKHHLSQLKDRVRKRKKLYATYTEEKKLTRITQRVIYAVYVKHYCAEDNESFKECFPITCRKIGACGGPWSYKHVLLDFRSIYPFEILEISKISAIFFLK